MTQSSITTEFIPVVIDLGDWGVKQCPSPTSTSKKQEKKRVPYEHKAALESAQNYVDTMPFSYSELRDQLAFSDYPEDAIDYAMRNVEVDYKEEAKEALDSYKDTLPMSKSEMREQLEFQGFKKESIDYAIKFY